MSERLERLREVWPDAVRSHHERFGDETAVVAAASLREVMAFVREDEGFAFDMLMDVTAVDYVPREPRFEVVYHLLSLATKHRLRIKVEVSEAEPLVASLTSLWASADWMEREVYDLYGIGFEGHPDLRRILLYDEFEGHPLRKDYDKHREQPLFHASGAGISEESVE